MDQTLPDITVEVLVNVPAERAWELFTQPQHIIQWNAASPDWHTPSATNDLRVGGVFVSRMEARDGSMGFDFTGTYTAVEVGKSYTYEIADGRPVHVQFSSEDGGTRIRQVFRAEGVHDPELQRAGWQSIMDNFARYVKRIGG